VTYGLRRVAGALALVAAVSAVAGCGRSDLHGSPQTKQKYDDLQGDPLYRTQLGTVTAGGDPLISAGSASEGPGDSSTSAYQHWSSPAFAVDVKTATTVAGFASEHGITALGVPTCFSKTQWTVNGLKQYGPWVAHVTFYLEPGKVTVDTQMGVGDAGRETLADARSRATFFSPPPALTKSCPAALIAHLKHLP
jgi:hypothetical protein